ncbi:MAG: 16S rRNA (cytidine(1402)-2'-O)-methyltransferase [Erysipelotrichaceae bacterium]|nr:16S rRNA (cytidine(1402)-2'-O)-methyltransferase [Erysipelotrichaceae bacterium]
MVNKNATLFLVATPIGNLNEVTPRALDVFRNVEVIACEDTRNSVKLLTHFDIHTKLITYHNFNEENSTKGIISLLEEGKDVALISDAGYPLISDPGYVLVNEVINKGFNIQTISGPSAGINALVASGLNTNHYLFYGFLNSKPTLAKKELKELIDFPYTLIFYEAPHRIEKTLKMCLEVFGNRKAVIARELTKLHEEYLRGTLEELTTLTDIKGEIVLLIEGKINEKQEISLESLLPQVEQLVKQGYKTKKAVQDIANEYNVSKNELYNQYVKDK